MIRLPCILRMTTRKKYTVWSIRGNSLENRISIESPLGKAIEGHHVGDQVEVKVNDKSSYVVEIRKIEKTGEEDSDRIRSY